MMPTRRTPRRSTAVRRTSPRSGPRAPAHLVDRMVVAVVGLVNAYIDRLMRELEPLLRQRFDARGIVRMDADSIRVPAVSGATHLSEQFLATSFHLVDRQAAIDLARVIPVSAETLLPHGAELERQFIRNNTELLHLESRAREEVRKVIEGPLRDGIRVEEVRQRLEERLGVVRSRAEFIARDQTLKLYGQIQEQRQTAAGIEEYTWSTSEDERVRPDHQALDGTTQRWDSPPVVDARSGRRANPGGDFQCRCAAIPILPSDVGAEDNPPLASEIAPPEAEPANEVTPAEAVPFGKTFPPANETLPVPPLAELQPSNIAANVIPIGAPRLTSQDALAAHLESRGMVTALPEQAHERLVRLLGQSPTAAQIDALLGHDAFAAVGGERRIAVEATSAKVEFRSEIVGRGTRLDPDVRLFRTLRRASGELAVHHDLFEIAPRLQAEGRGATAIAAQLRAYEELRVGRIDLDAAWIGRYYWPKLGFDLKSPGRVQDYVRMFRTYIESKGFAPAVVSGLTEGITTMQEIATTRIGAALLGKDFLAGDPLDPLDPKGRRGPAAAGRLIEGLTIAVRPGEPRYERMKREVSK